MKKTILLLFSLILIIISRSLYAQQCAIPVGNVTGGGNICFINDNGSPLVQISGSIPAQYGDGIFYNLLRNGNIIQELSARDIPYWPDRELPGPGRYTIQAYNTYCSVMYNGFVDVTFNTGITPFTVYGNSNSCYEGQKMSIYLSGSQVGISYQLRLGQEEIRALKPGTGGVLVWDDLTFSGDYSVFGVKPDGCMAPMDGQVTIQDDFQIDVMTVLGSGHVCQINDNGSPLLSISLSEQTNFADGIFYKLLKDGVEVLTPRDIAYWADRELPGSGYYTVIATNQYCSVLMNGGATVTFAAELVEFNMGGGNNQCIAGQFVPITLSGSQIGVSYQLRLGQEEVRPLKQGTGGPLVWDDINQPGIYSIFGIGSDGCSAKMNGSIEIVNNNQINVHQVVGGGNVCIINDNGSPLVVVGINGSAQAGVQYQLLQNGLPVLAPRDIPSWADRELPGTGNYTIIASNGICTVTMQGSVNVNFQAELQQFSVMGGGFCCDVSGQQSISLSGSEIGIDYQLRLGLEQIGSILSGTGQKITWNGLTAPGKYTVYGITSLNCSVKMNGEADIFDYQDLSFIKTVSVLKSGITDVSSLHNLSSVDIMVKKEFYDGLGRNFQTVHWEFSPLHKDLVQIKEFNNLGLEERNYLPFTSSLAPGEFKSDILNSSGNYTHDFYANFFDKVADGVPYSQTVFEPSPLNRVIKQGSPGEAWQPDGVNTYNSTDHTVKYSYESNLANEVLQWTFTLPTEEYTTTALNAFGKLEVGTATTPVFYPANQLYKNKTKDEQGNQVIEYIDKEGRTVLKRVQVIAGNPSTTDTNRDTNWASTYYIYDDFGNLVCVIPPEPSKRLTTQYFQAGSTETTKNNFLKRWAFRYRYDGRQRMIMKQVPGAEPVYMVYDGRDRLVLTQDGNQRTAPTSYWTFTKYDALNRPISTGLKDTSAIITLGAMQNLLNNFYSKPSSRYYEEYVGDVVGNMHGYTNKSFPTTNRVTSGVAYPDASYYLSITYYDDYTPITNWGSDYQYNDLNLQAAANGVTYNQPDSSNNRVKGQVTATKTKVLDGSIKGGTTWLKSINYFDEKYRVIQSISDNYKGGTEEITSIYDFSGKVLLTKSKHSTYDITWGDFVNASLQGNKLIAGSSLPGTWGHSGAASLQKSSSNEDLWAEFTIPQNWGTMVVGLSNQNPDANFTSIQFGFIVVGESSLRICESGNTILHIASGYKIGDVLKITRTGSTIKYYKNNNLVYTSLLQSTSELLLDVAFNNNNWSVANARSSFSKNESNTIRRFGYDHAGRLINTWHKFNDQPEILLAHNDYNELGQLIDKKLHVSSPVGGGQEGAKQSVDYAYNIRGWLTHINDAALTPQTGESKDHFGMELAYNTDLGTGNPSDKLQFNGNINAMKWSNSQGLGDQKENAYNFTYDPLNRLKTANFKQKDISNWGLAKHRAANGTMQSVDAFKEHINSYDLNGNIEQLQRSGQDGLLIDDLTYSYGVATSSHSNKLLRVTDATNDTEGFKEINTTLDDYLYDSNGNLIQDRNKPTEEAVRNGSFDNGSDQWQLTQPGRLTFANGRVTITAGTSIALIDQNTPLRSSTPYLIFIEMVRTSATGTVKVLAGSNTGAGYSATGNAYTTTGSLDRVGLEISPDFEGYIESISVRTFALISYNYLNLPERIIKGEGESMQYIYTATGQKLAQVVMEGTKTKTTDYVGEYVYQNDTLLFVNHEEGRISLSSTSPLSSGEGQGGEAEYQYHLKDHLGNVRLTFTTKEETEETLATLETTNENEERANFLKYDDIRKVNSRLFDHTHAPGVGTTHYAIRLSGTPQETYGLARSIAVMPGDVISAEVFAKYVDLNDPNVETFLENLAASIVAGTTSPGVVIDGGNFGTPAALNMPFGTILNKLSEAAGTPKAYLNWIVLDKNFRAILSKSGYRRVTTAASENGSLDPANGLAAEGFPHERLFTPTIEVTEPGYVYIYLSNEEAGTEVYFDDFKVTHMKSPVIQSDDYYPFGLAFNSYQRENSTPNQYLYNSKELQDELNLGWLDYGARMYQPDLGRWGVVDPMSESRNWLSPYNYVQNNPILRIDPDGMLDNDYSIDKAGNIVLEKLTKDKFDVLYAKADYDKGNKENGIKIQDQTILPELLKIEIVNGYEISKSTKSGEKADDLFKIFKFASDKTDVEWTMFRHSDSDKITLGTAHDEGDAASYSYYGLKSEPTAKIHSHPDIDTSVEREMNSMGYVNKNQMYQPSDWNNVRNNLDKNGNPKVSSYVYFPNSTRLYNINKLGPAYIRHINNDHKRLFVGKLK